MLYTNENRDYKVTIDQDLHAESPREWGYSSKMLCFHKRYNLGDQDHGVDDSMFKSWDGMERYLRRQKGAKVILPIYMLDHSGLTVNTSGFSCGWDSGQIGFIYLDGETIEKEHGVKRVTKEFREELEQKLRDEVETYDRYLKGEVYNIVVKKLVYNEETNRMDEEIVDSCGGIYMCDSMERFKNICLEQIEGIDANVLDDLLKGLE